MWSHQDLEKKSIILLFILVVLFTLSCNSISQAINKQVEPPISNIPEPFSTPTKSPTPIIIETITTKQEELTSHSIWQVESYSINFEFSYDPFLWEVKLDSYNRSGLVSLIIDNCSLYPAGGHGFSEDWTLEMEHNYHNIHNLRKGTLLDNLGQVQSIYYYPDDGMFGLEISNSYVECAISAEEVIVTYKKTKNDD